MTYHLNQLTHQIIGAAIEVHKQLGLGLLESAYRSCLCRELFLRGIKFKFEDPLPLEYKGLRLKRGYRVDLLINFNVEVLKRGIHRRILGYDN